MASITFKYICENEVTISGDDYESIYHQFITFQHGEETAAQGLQIHTRPPRDEHVLFSTDTESSFHDIEKLTGSFRADILSHTGPIKDNNPTLKNLDLQA